MSLQKESLPGHRSSDESLVVVLSSEDMETLISGNDEQTIIFEDIHKLNVLGVILFLCEIFIVEI